MINQTSILVIYTGGTIGMVQDPKTMTLSPLTFDILYKYLPVLENFNCRIDFYTFEPLLDSSNMNPSFWIHLATVIEEKYEDYDGFVVLHGSDTMAYTASALSFMLENLNKPVIFTGSQLPIGMVRTDGRENFINSIEIAAAKDVDTPVVPEVAICFENKLYRGNRTSKLNAENFKAFVSGNYPLLGEVGVHIRYYHNMIMKPNFKKLRVLKDLDENIAILKLFPLDQYVDSPVALMDNGDSENRPAIWVEYKSIVEKNEGDRQIELVERFAFYERAKKAYAVVATGETAIYANVILKKGVVI